MFLSEKRFVMYLLGTKVAGERYFSIFVDDLLVTVELGDQVATVVTLVTLHRLRLQVSCEKMIVFSFGFKLVSILVKF